MQHAQTCNDTSSHSTEVEARRQQRVQTISAATGGEDKTCIELLITKKRRRETFKCTKSKHVSETPPPAGDLLLKLSGVKQTDAQELHCNEKAGVAQHRPTWRVFVGEALRCLSHCNN